MCSLVCFLSSITLQTHPDCCSISQDAGILLVPFVSPGVNDVGDAYVHMGFLTAYNAVAYNILYMIEKQLELYPGYSIVSTGQLRFLP